MHSQLNQADSGKEPAPAPARTDLSEREREILRLVATGASNKEIAARLDISPNTVKVHLRNIFAKVGVASRTEATLFAIRQGLVAVPGDASAPAAAGQEPSPSQPTTAAPAAPATVRPAIPWSRYWWVLAVVLILAISLGAWIGPRLLSTPAGPPQSTGPTAPPRWSSKADMLTARFGLAVTTYESQVYAIGGETSEGVTGAVERYDPGSNSWEPLAEKPLPVADVGAAVVGGQIYVPGGRLASGQMTGALEVYDPRTDRWEQRASLPVALSAYALAAFEGKLYLFGGWDGQTYLATVYEYDPGQNRWTERAPLPTARAFAGAAVAGGGIYVVGGTAGGEPLTANEEYLPVADVAGENPWHKRADLPTGRSAMGIASIADIVHVVGGQAADQPVSPLKYFPQRNEWQTFDLPDQEAGSGLGLGVVEADLHVIGGDVHSAPTAHHLTYQAIYTVVLPIVQ